MKRAFLAGLVGSVVLCATSNLVMAAQDQNSQNQSGCDRPWYLRWIPCATPSSGVPPIPGYSPAPSNSNQSNGANPFPTQAPLQTAYQPPPGWFSNAFHRLFGGSSPTPQPVANPFGIVKGASATAPPLQPIPEVNRPRTPLVEPAPQPPVARMNASEPIPEPKPTQEQSIQDQLARMTSAEKSSLNAKTDAAFYAKHPELAGIFDPVTNPIAAQQWIAERNNILAAKAPGTSGPPIQRQTSMTAQNAIPNPQPPPALPTIPTVPPINAPHSVPAVPPTIAVNANSAVPPANTLPTIPTVPPINPAKLAQEKEQERQRQAQLALQQQQERDRQAKLAQEKEQERQRQARLALQQQQERDRQAKLAQEKEQERQRQAKLAQEKEQGRQRHAKLAQEKEQERQRQAKLAQEKEQERQRQAKLAQQKEQERKRQAQLAQQKQQERQIKAYNAAVKQQQQQAYRQWQQQEAYRQWQQQQQQQVMSPEEMFYATHGGRNALTEAAWAAGAYR
jgi:hypothetical protein